MFMTNNKYTRVFYVALLILIVLALAGFGPVQQGVQRFVTILTQRITVSTDLTSQGTSNFDGAVDFDSTVDFTGGTVTGLGSYYTTDDTGAVIITGTLAVSDTATFTSSATMLDTLSVAGASSLNGGLAMDTTAFTVADSTGNTVISGTLAISDAQTNLSTLNMSNKAISNIGAAGTDFSSVGGLTTASTITVTAGGLVVSAGDTDLAGGLNYGADNLYPLGYSTSGFQVVCGTTALTGSTALAVTGLTSVTYVIPWQITAPITTAAYVYGAVTYPTTVTITSLDMGFSAGTTSVTAGYCALGDQ